MYKHFNLGNKNNKKFKKENIRTIQITIENVRDQINKIKNCQYIYEYIYTYMNKYLLLQKYNIFLFYNYLKILQKLNKFSIINNYLNT